MFCVLCLSLNLEKFEERYHHCTNCDLVFLEPAFRLDSENEFDRYQMHENDFLETGYQNFVRPLVDAVIERLEPPAIGIDFGSGPDSAAGYLLRQEGYDVAKYDPFFHPDPTVLEKKYDFLVACEVVEHFYTPGESFDQMCEILKPKAHLVLMTTLREADVDFKTWYYRRDETHVSFYSKKTFEWIKKRFQFQALSFSGKNLIVLST